jgi:hypothetical protein
VQLSLQRCSLSWAEQLGQKFAGFFGFAFTELLSGGTLSGSIKDMPAKNIIAIRIGQLRSQVPES